MSKLSDAIFAADLDLRSELVDIPEWGVKVKVLEPTAEVRATLAQRFVEAAEDGTGMKLVELYPALLITTVVDPEDDTPVFTQADAGQINQKEGRIVEDLAKAAIRVSGLDEGAEDPKEGSSETPNVEASTPSPND